MKYPVWRTPEVRAKFRLRREAERRQKEQWVEMVLFYVKDRPGKTKISHPGHRRRAARLWLKGQIEGKGSTAVAQSEGVPVPTMVDLMRLGRVVVAEVYRSGVLEGINNPWGQSHMAKWREETSNSADEKSPD